MTTNPEFKTLWEALDEEDEERLRLLLKLGLNKITAEDLLEALTPKPIDPGVGFCGVNYSKGDPEE